MSYLRSKIGYVGQEPALFATTIEQNIRYGKPGASREEIEEAAKKANAHDFIQSLPDGYLTQVGDKGGQLSGGEIFFNEPAPLNQCSFANKHLFNDSSRTKAAYSDRTCFGWQSQIAIVRTVSASMLQLQGKMHINSPFFFFSRLDEATSALDSESELVVQEAIEKLLVAEKRTTIIIAHRLTTIRNADVIVVIAGGRVVERGTHDELMESATGHYRALVLKQESGLDGGDSQGPSRTSSEKNLAAAGGSMADLMALESSRRKSVMNLTQLRFKDVRFAYPTRP